MCGPSSIVLEALEATTTSQPSQPSQPPPETAEKTDTIMTETERGNPVDDFAAAGGDVAPQTPPSAESMSSLEPVSLEAKFAIAQTPPDKIIPSSPMILPSPPPGPEKRKRPGSDGPFSPSSPSHHDAQDQQASQAMDLQEQYQSGDVEMQKSVVEDGEKANKAEENPQAKCQKVGQECDQEKAAASSSKSSGPSDSSHPPGAPQAEGKLKTWADMVRGFRDTPTSQRGSSDDEPEPPHDAPGSMPPRSPLRLRPLSWDAPDQSAKDDVAADSQAQAEEVDFGGDDHVNEDSEDSEDSNHVSDSEKGAELPANQNQLQDEPCGRGGDVADQGSVQDSDTPSSDSPSYDGRFPFPDRMPLTDPLETMYGEEVALNPPAGSQRALQQPKSAQIMRFPDTPAVEKPELSFPRGWEPDKDGPAFELYEDNNRFPRSIHDLFQYSEFQWAKAAQATGDAKSAIRYAAQMLVTHTYSTCFSGIDAPGTASCVASANLEAILELPPGTLKSPRHLSACEKYKPSRDELMNHPSAPECCFSNVTDFWKPSVKNVINKMKKAKAAWSRDTFMTTIKAGARAMNTDRTAYCCVHNRPGTRE
eukprot:Skav200753  [mRNA]  locus=scaffold1117:399821:402244:- [translate_table: standard]